MCRKAHGAAFVTWGTVQRSEFQWLSGEELVKHYRSSSVAERLFCAECGSSLMVLYEGEPEIGWVTLGTVDGDPKCRPGYHIFVGSKAPWFEITDGLPQNDTWGQSPPWAQPVD